jgi:hypothetical protein
MNVEEFRTPVKGGVEEKKSDFIKTESLVKEKIWQKACLKFGGTRRDVHIPKQNTGCI